MGVIYEYFAAPSDTVAADLIDAGPGGPLPVSPALQEALRTGDREALRLAMRPKLRASEAGILVLSTKGIDPVVLMGTLEALLTDESYNDIRGRPRHGCVLAERGEGESVVVTLTDELQVALATAAPDRLVAVAGPWSQTDEFFGGGDPEVLVHLLLELADLAQKARQRNEHLYCWICL